MNAVRRYWLIGLGGCVLLITFLLSDGLNHTLSYKRATAKAKAEAKLVQEKIKSVEKQLVRIRLSKEEHSQLVRQELGYVRPGETEIRFVRRSREEK